MLALPFISRSISAPSTSASPKSFRQLPPPASFHHPRRKPSTTHVPWAPYQKQLRAGSTASPSLVSKLTGLRPSRVMSVLVSVSLLLAFVYLCATAEIALMSGGPSPATARAMRSGGAMGRSMQMQQRASVTGYGGVLKSPSANAPRIVNRPIRSSPLPSAAKAASVIPLTPQEELSSLVDYLTSHSSHSLPLDIDPSVPLLPDTILDVSLPLDIKRRAKVLAEVGQETWDRWPVVVIGATKATAKARTLLKHESLLGAAGHGLAFLETNSRPDARILTSILARLTSIPAESPIVLIGGLPYSLAEFDGIYKDGWLQQLMQQAGATLGTEQRKREAKEKRQKIAMQKLKLNLGDDEEDF